MNKTVYRNIFKEYNIPRDTPKKRKKSLKLKPKNVSYQSHEDHTIDNFSEDEAFSPSYQYVQLKRSFEHSLQAFTTQGNQVCETSNRMVGSRRPLGICGNHSLPKDGGNSYLQPNCYDYDDDMMPRPMIVKEEPSEEIQLSWHSSTISSTASNVLERRLKLQEALDKSFRRARLRETLPSSDNNLITPSLNCSRKYSRLPKRYQSIEISIIKKASPRRSLRVALMNKTQNKSCRKNLSSSWLSSDEEPFQNGPSSPGNKSYVCSSPKASQIIQTPSSTASPRKTPTKPTELDLMIELIEKENAAKVARLKKSPRKSSKRPLPGGFVEMYERCLAKAKTDSKFIKHDKKYGIVNGVILRVLKLECSHGVHLAKVQRVQGRDKHIFGIVLPDELISQLKSNSKIEAFFDETTKPYKLPDTTGGKFVEVYIKPHKLLML